MIPVTPQRFNDALERLLENVRALSLTTLSDGTLECRVSLHSSNTSSCRNQLADESRAAFLVRCILTDCHDRARHKRPERATPVHR